MNLYIQNHSKTEGSNVNNPCKLSGTSEVLLIVCPPTGFIPGYCTKKYPLAVLIGLGDGALRRPRQ